MYFPVAAYSNASPLHLLLQLVYHFHVVRALEQLTRLVSQAVQPPTGCVCLEGEELLTGGQGYVSLWRLHEQSACVN